MIHHLSLIIPYKLHELFNAWFGGSLMRFKGLTPVLTPNYIWLHIRGVNKSG